MASASKEGSKTDKATSEKKETSIVAETTSTSATTTADVTMEEDDECKTMPCFFLGVITLRFLENQRTFPARRTLTFHLSTIAPFKIKKRTRRVIDTDDEDEPIALAVEAEISLTQKHREEDLTATTKKLKLDPTSPQKPKASSTITREKTKETVQETVKEVKEKVKAVVEDVVETHSVSEDKEFEEAEKEDEEQEKEAVEIKQAAAKWADMFSKSAGVESASWKKGEPVPYAALCQTFELIEDTTKRLQILDYLVKFLIQVIKLSPESLLTVIYLSINKVRSSLPHTLCPRYLLPTDHYPVV